MTLTIGTGPFGRETAGRFNFTRSGPAHVLYWEDQPKRVRLEVAGETIADTRRAKLLHETGLLPVTYLPLEDVRSDLLEDSDRSSHCPFKGDARYWSVRVGDRLVEDLLWGYPEPLEGAPPLAGYVAPYVDRVDAWYEEDERLLGHPHDPYHRVDALRSSRHVRVLLDGETVADTTRPVLVFETGLPPRPYLPREDVRMTALQPSDTTSVCPYKGVASYWAVEGEDVAWSYEDPLPEATAAGGHLAFLTGDHVVVEVDGEPLG